MRVSERNDNIFLANLLSSTARKITWWILVAHFSSDRVHIEVKYKPTIKQSFLLSIKGRSCSHGGEGKSKNFIFRDSSNRKYLEIVLRWHFLTFNDVIY